LTIALSILPLVLTILCGYGLVRTQVLPRDQWSGIETLSFRLLVPAVLIKSIALSDLSSAAFGPMIFALISASAVSAGIVVTFRWMRTPKALPNPVFTTVFQTATRWNAFIALAAAELFVGGEAVALIAMSMAVLIPLINIVNIIVLSLFGSATPSAGLILKTVLNNPLVQACAIGLILNLSGILMPNFIVQTLDLIGRAALGVGILTVGAAIKPRRLFNTSSAMWFGVLARVICGPIIFLTGAEYVGLGPLEQAVGVIIMAAPAASNGYIVAKKMGGDADLYADILAWQILLSMLILPAFMVLLST
jgi:predicted permease